MEDAVRDVRIFIKFLPQSLRNAILLYNAANATGNGDFIALVIDNEHIALKYDLGSGLCVKLLYFYFDEI